MIEFCQFALLCEGKSDHALVYPLESLLVSVGFDEVLGNAYSPGGAVDVKLQWLLQNHPDLDIIFIHRDADKAGMEARRDEILTCQKFDGTISANKFGDGPPDSRPVIIPIVPVTMTETWALFDEGLIREVCGNPAGKNSLSLPSPKSIESHADPKATLYSALVEAHGGTGRRKPSNDKLNEWRSRIIARLDVNGPVSRLDTWKLLVSDVAQARSELYPHNS